MRSWVTLSSDMTTKNYVGAAHDWDTDTILVWERTDPEQRTLRRVKAPRYFYVPCEDGEYTSFFGEKLAKITCDSIDEFNVALKSFPPSERHESDISPVLKVLMNEYYKKPLPVLNFAFVDIEVDVKKSLGWSTISNPYAPINAVTIYQSWTDRYVTLLVPPRMYEKSKFADQIKAVGIELKLDFLEKTDFTLCTNETELLMKLLDAIQNADIISGWNSEFFDIPMIMKRLERISPKLMAKMSFPGAKAPRVVVVRRFGEEALTYKLFGRTHLDYLALFKKFAQDVRYPTYSLGFVGEAEVGVPKVHFEGHFEDFYNGTHRPNVSGMTMKDADKVENKLDKLNVEREIIRQEIEKRGLKVPEREKT